MEVGRLLLGGGGAEEPAAAVATVETAFCSMAEPIEMAGYGRCRLYTGFVGGFEVDQVVI